MSDEKLGCLGSILRLFGMNPGSQSSREEVLPFRQRDHFLSPSELSFFQVLKGVVADQQYVCAKVRVSDLLYVVDRKNNISHANRIDRKHVDFVLCDRRTMRPVLVVELDDASHQNKDRADRDDLLDAAFGAAGLAVLHVRAAKGYSVSELEQQIQSRLSAADKTPAQKTKPVTGIAGQPSCPKCKIPMVERKSTKGAHAGKRFWACPSYPECREIIGVD